MSDLLTSIQQCYERSRALMYADPPEALRLACEATAMLTTELPAAFRVKVMFQQVEMLMGFGRIHEGTTLLHDTLLIAETENLEAERGNLLYTLGIAHYTTADFSTAIDYWRDCLNLDNRGFSVETRINAFIALGQMYFAFHMPEDALRHHLSAQKYLHEGIDLELRARLYINLVADYCELGRYAEAQPLLDEAEQICQQIQHLEYLGEALSYRTLMLLQQDKLEEVTALLERGHSMDRYWAWGEISWKIVTGKIAMAEDNLAAAIAAFEEALSLSQKYECTSKVHVVHATLAIAYGQAGQPAQAEKHQRLYQEHYNRLGSAEIFARLQDLEQQLHNT
ncbi:tetratricopeptide repeat protein [Chitinibacter tainanensis]|uniref:tetratricopeptide repeat protein n=1 Tax=Chitinibacter tainanensis TaxID=230667 RepID=UPI0023554E36|nr:tetratricopeptide repeat protein [Chitinibacter tainanensis]